MAEMHTNATGGATVSFTWPHPLGDLIKAAEAVGLSVEKFIATTMELSVTAIPDWEELVKDPSSYDSTFFDEVNEMFEKKDADDQANGGNR